jgi:hypothetical protein
MALPTTEDSVSAIARLRTEIEALRATGVLDDDSRIRDRLAAIETHNARMRESIELQEKREAQLRIELSLLEKNNDFYKERNESLDAFIKKEQIELDLNEEYGQKKLFLLKREVETALEREGIESESYQLAIDKLATAQKEYEIRKKELETAKQIGDETKKVMASTFGISTKWKDTLWGKFFDKDSDIKTNLTAVGKSFTDTFTRANIAGSLMVAVFEETAKAFKQYDAASSSIAKVAGDNERLQKVLQNTSRGATAYGISFAEAGKAIEGLYTELNTFSTLSQTAQQQLTVSTAKLEKLGISSQQSAKQIATLTQIMGMTEVQAAKTSEQLAGFALSIGRSPTQVASDFAAASDKLGAYGDKMIDVFKNLETQSKGTGVALNDILSLTEKFETFEGAATAAGKLNAALGGGFVNAMELLEASAEDPSKVIDLLRTRLNDAGLAFDQLSINEKKLIANAAGFKSVEQASRILSMTNAEAERAAKADAERAAQQELVNDAIQRSIPIQQKLELIMANLAIAVGPVVEVLSAVFSVIGAIIDHPIGKFLMQLGITAALILSPLGWIAGAIYAIVAAFTAFHDILFVPHSPILFDSLKEMSSIFDNIGSATNKLDSNLMSSTNNFDKFGKSVKGSIAEINGLPTETNKTIELTDKVSMNTKRTVEAVNSLSEAKATQAVNIMTQKQEQQTPQVIQQPQVVQQAPPQVKVYIGNTELKQEIYKTTSGGSNLSPQVLSKA